MMTAFKSIQKTLAAVARKEHVRILYACESGSRAWGFASPDSDYDVRFIFVRPPESYIRIHPPRDVIEMPLEGLLDISGWDALKACRLATRSNPPLVEWLNSPIVYSEDDGFTSRLRREIREHFSVRSCCEHYLSMARRQCRDYIEGRDVVIRKKYLYALRPVLCVAWLLDRKTFPPTRFNDVLAGVDLPTQVVGELRALLADKAHNRELGESASSATLGAFLSERMADFEERVKSVPHRPFPSDGLNALLTNTILV